MKHARKRNIITEKKSSQVTSKACAVSDTNVNNISLDILLLGITVIISLIIINLIILLG